MSYEHCDTHDCDATNGCALCTIERERASLLIQCPECDVLPQVFCRRESSHQARIDAAEVDARSWVTPSGEAVSPTEMTDQARAQFENLRKRIETMYQEHDVVTAPLVDDDLEKAQQFIAEECDAIKTMLLAKNRAYGNSALSPLRVFSKASHEEQIRVRLDDKLSRLMRGTASGEDVEFDLIGYIVLLRVFRKMRESGKS